MLALERQIRVNLFEWPELDVEIQDLIVAAEEVRHNAWAPYSHYKVGVALLSQSGSVHIGCNVERASYTQTTHAEQNAIDSMVAAEGPNDLIDTMVIIGGPE